MKTSGWRIDEVRKEDTAYPFDERIDFHVSFVDKKVKKAFFPFHIRIPPDFVTHYSFILYILDK